MGLTSGTHKRETPNDYRADPRTGGIGRLAIMAHSALCGRTVAARGEIQASTMHAARAHAPYAVFRLPS
ncbi:hypothetical protein BN2475_950031 [Paraburkholderia ribeironis]|uniref:Uncharacterized protein n=1 Tax=Paraburkholderia ribeironis TaxID=1247936 RepID=A0A1N7SLC6_9BURK|nr:hypothetical protein BN2475_950031 [Paraburkholderia ribeironis]